MPASTAHPAKVLPRHPASIRRPQCWTKACALSGCAGMRRSGQMLIPPVANRAIAAAAMSAAVSHPRMLAALPFT
jgi:hypothetical protein